MRKVIVKFEDSFPMEFILGEDGNQKTAVKINFIDLQNSPCGFGDTDKEAINHLCGQLGLVLFGIGKIKED